jgi:hypothetical protein
MKGKQESADYGKVVDEISSYLPKIPHSRSDGHTKKRKDAYFGGKDVSLSQFAKAILDPRYYYAHIADEYDTMMDVINKPSNTSRATPQVKRPHAVTDIKRLEPLGTTTGVARANHSVPSETKSSNVPKGILRQMTKVKAPRTRTAIAPVSVSVQMPHRSQKYNGRDALSITHREYIGDVVSAGTTFNCTQFATLMPGDPCSYPWLSKLAALFAKFTWKRARLIYVPTCSTTTGGVVIISYDPNAQRTIPASKVALLEYEVCARGAPWAENIVDCKGMARNLYSFYGNQPSGGLTGNVVNNSTYLNVDIKTYSAGQIFVGLDGVSAGAVGELYIEYDVEFSDPGIWNVPLVQIHIFGTAQGASSFFPTVTNTTILSNIASSAPSENYIIFPDFPAGQYMIFSKALTSSTESAISVQASGTGVTTLGGSWNASGTTANTWSFFQVSAPTSVILTASGFAHLSGSADLVVVPFDRNLSSIS